MTAGTFHSVCQRLLRRHGAAIGIPIPFTVLDGEDQADLVTIARDAVLAGRSRRPSLPRPAAIAGLVQQAAESGRPLADVVRERNGRLVDRLDELDEIAAEYARRKRDLAALDYADLLVEGRRLLREEGARARGRIRWSVVDELHDVSPIQAEIAELLAGEGGGLFAVGDPDQAIYGWRGADPDVVDRFGGTPGTRVVKLQHNYRSRPEVVALAQRMLPGDNRHGRRLVAVRPPGGVAPVVAHLADVRDEATFVAQRIADCMNEGRAAGDIAVLYRAHHHSIDLQLALAEAGVEFELHSGARFVESAHVKDALAACRVRHNVRDQLAWTRLLRLLPGVGDVTATRAATAAAEAGDPREAGARIRAAGAGRADRLAADLADALGERTRPEDLVLTLARSDWYRDSLRSRYPNHEDREADLARLAELAARSADLDRFLAEMQLAERVEADEDVSGPARRVALSTVHQAKGLEWPVVFVLQVESGSFPSGWAVSEGNLEEEERLFYVALTRAGDELYLCRPIAARRPWDTGANAIAINSGQGFLDVDLGDLVEEWSVR
jgi:DNA helicase-2/ATP-dependent DNA helicase PcrA